MLRWSGFDLEIIEARDGFLLLRVTGKKAKKAFSHEAGGHRFQRVPPNEKRGRVHTSTITVAILDLPKEREFQIDPKDLDEKFTRGSGAGGQHRNKTDTCVILTHIPTGIKVRIDGGRSQYINRQTALEVLQGRLKAQEGEQASHGRNATRRSQLGSGMRGDKVRTIAVQRNQVVDHQTGRCMNYEKYRKGHLTLLW